MEHIQIPKEFWDKIKTVLEKNTIIYYEDDEDNNYEIIELLEEMNKLENGEK